MNIEPYKICDINWKIGQDFRYSEYNQYLVLFVDDLIEEVIIESQSRNPFR